MNASQEQMMAKMDAWLAEMMAWRKETMACQEVTETCLESKGPTSLKIEFKAEHEEVPKEEAAVESWSTEGAVQGSASSCKAPWSAEEMDPGQWWSRKKLDG
jgi:hypothetical protein